MNVTQDKKDYFRIPAKILGTKAKSFMFNIYVLHEEDNSISIDTKAHHKISEDHLQGYSFLEQKGYQILIENKQKSILFLELGIHETDLVYEREEDITQKKEALNYLDQKELYEKEIANFKFSEEWKRAIKSNNYKTIIAAAKKEIFCFPINESITVSNARLLADLLDDDGLTNRVVAISYFFAKTLGIKEVSQLAAIVCAAYLKDIGTLFLNYHLENAPIESLDRALQADYLKHPKLTLFLLNKFGIELSDSCLQYISQHHETPDGLGFPSGLVGASVDPLGQVIGIVDQFFRFLGGHIIKTKLSAYEILALWEKGENPQGMKAYHEEYRKQFTGLLRSAA